MKKHVMEGSDWVPAILAAIFLSSVAAPALGQPVMQIECVEEGCSAGGGPDCNQNGCDDVLETASDCTSNACGGVCAPDCDSNGRPDECDPDCNNNGVVDACESLCDCNNNRIPDECELTAGSAADLNSNGSLDECDIGPFQYGFELAEGFTTNGIGGQVLWAMTQNVNPNAAAVVSGVFGPNGIGGIGAPNDHSLRLTPDTDLSTNGSLPQWRVWTPRNGSPDLDEELWQVDVRLGSNRFPETELWIVDSCGSTLIPAAAVRWISFNDTPVLEFCRRVAEGQCAWTNVTPFSCVGNPLCNAWHEVNISISRIPTVSGFEVTIWITGDTQNSQMTNRIHSAAGDRQLVLVVDNEVPTGESPGEIHFDNIRVSGHNDCNVDNRDDADDIAGGIECAKDNCDLSKCSFCGVRCGDSDFEPGTDGLGKLPTSCDANTDGIPDDCQDCNFDGVLDPEQVGTWPATDCDGNGVIDVCDLAPQSWPYNPWGGSSAGQDCDANGEPDVCQFADCNANGDSDVCEVAAGSATDNNGDQVPDECPGCEASPGNGDGNFDGKVNGADVVSFDSIVSTCTSNGTTNGMTEQCQRFDLDGDCDVDADDRALLVVLAAGPLVGIAPEGAGPARPWEVSIDLSPFSSVNLANGNVVTAMPIVGWGGLGGGLSVSLYHNSIAAAATDAADVSRLGRGWRTSFTAQVIDNGDGTVSVIEEDGTRNDYTSNGGAYLPPAGVFDKLVVEAGSGWTVTRKNQSKWLFDVDGLLSAVLDASTNGANQITISRDAVDGTIKKITDASGRTVTFNYADARLTSITASGCRTWTFVYDGDQVFRRLYEPMGFFHQFDYDTNGRIIAVHDQDFPAPLQGEPIELPRVYRYTYDGSARLIASQDPRPFDNQRQAFAYAQGSEWIATVTDRRNAAWEYRFNTNGELVGTEDPLSATTAYDYGTNGIHLVETFTNERNNTWTYRYDVRGNLLRTTDPLGHSVVSTYDVLNNLLSTTDALGHLIEHRYEDPNDPTLRTSTIEQVDGQGNPPAETVMAYYGPGDHPEWSGLLKTVTDANDTGMIVTYEYNTNGQVSLMTEGPPYNGVLSTYPGVFRTSTVDDRGYVTSNGTSTHVSGIDYSDDGLCGGGTHGITGIFPSGARTGTSCKAMGVVMDPSTRSMLDFQIGCLEGCNGGGRGPDPPYGGLIPWLPCQGNDPDRPTAHTTAATYDVRGNTLTNQVEKDMRTPNGIFVRKFNMEYDVLNRVTRSLTDSMPENGQQREFRYDYTSLYGPGGSRTIRTGPGGRNTTTNFDAAGRVSSVDMAGEMRVIYTYLSNGLVQRATYGNDTYTDFGYDAADRTTLIHHQDAGGTILKLEYAYYDNDTVQSITETDVSDNVAVTTFTYDGRDRLIHEIRTNGVPELQYDLSYTYDQVGNRLRKVGTVGTGSPSTVIYHYDVHEQEWYKTRNNRLMWYTVSVSGQEDVTYWYVYDDEGNPTRIVNSVPGGTFEAVRFDYYSDGKVWRVIGESWTGDGTTWYEADGHAYSVPGVAYADWNTARSEAQNAGAYLATVETVEEMDWLGRVFGDPNQQKDFWIGAYQDISTAGTPPWDGPWKWAEDDEVDVALSQSDPKDARWLPNQPDDTDGTKNVVQLVTNENGNFGTNGFSDVATTGVANAIWERNPGDCQPNNNYAVTFAWEFRYDSARARYLRRQLTYVPGPTPAQDTFVPASDEWSDYDGNDIYADFTTNGAGGTTLTKTYLAGTAETDDPDGSPDTSYYLANLIGSTRATDAATGGPEGRITYTAFGQPVGTDGVLTTRYRYAGAHGYQSHPEIDAVRAFPFLHVGARWYDPATGRFLQRDPIGISDGLNIYEYILSRPNDAIDVSGTKRHDYRWPGGAPGGQGGRFRGLPGATKAVRWLVKRTPIYLAATTCARIGHRIAGKPYEDPLSIIGDTLGNLGRAAVLHVKIGVKKLLNPDAFPAPASRDRPLFWRCFVSGTLIHTPNGLVSIESLSPGSEVLAGRPPGPACSVAQVIGTFQDFADSVANISFGDERITCTLEHPFWVIDRGWVRAAHLRVGDELQLLDGTSVAVTTILREKPSDPIRVFNLTIDSSHVFYVGRSGVLVHNKMR